MAPSVAQTARIFEDSDADSNPLPKKSFPSPRKNNAGPSPLGERHINSPPQAVKVPLKDEPQSRPRMHKKTGSATSFKGFLLGREKSNDGTVKSKDESSKENRPKKSKSATNLASLLKKRSKKDLKSECKPEEVQLPPSPSKAYTPIWAQFATQPLETHDGSKQYPNALSPRSLAIGTPSLTPQSYSDQHSASPGQVQSYFEIGPELRRPQRPYLEKRGSRSSIFTEELNDESTSTRPPSMDLSQGRPECSRQQSADSNASSKAIPVEQKAETPVKSKSKMFDTLAAFNIKSPRGREPAKEVRAENKLDTHDLDSALENVLGRYDIPQNLRDNLRNLKPEVKAGLVKGERIGSGSSIDETHLSSRSNEKERPSSKDKENEDGRPRSRSRPRSRVFSISKRNKDTTAAKADESTRSRSKGRPKSAESSARPLSAISNLSTTSLTSISANDGTSTPGDFIHYLREVQKPELVEVGKIHKLRILLRNKSVQWTDVFVNKGGLDEIAQLLHRIMAIEWREEHEDNLLHETLLCIKALATTNLAMQRLESMEQDLFPALVKMLFDPERKGPAEFSTRALVISMLFAYLSATLHMDSTQHEKRARAVLKLIRDPDQETARAPHPAAPYVGGVEWEATQYLATHLDLLNGLIVSMPTHQERNQLREELKQSGFEKVMGVSLRTCKENFYGSVHDGLRFWVAAATADGWSREDVRAGPPREASSPRKSPVKKKQEEAPQLKLDVGLNAPRKADDGWL
ncbi:hypothetical protein LTR64_000596 [Lithohypha guttulata]|uniref:uncharacterized protein n=1 Tax=Lithohypha guttulata TaxID=1690604 RepID=UPI002DE000E1|nr:hypothetical protein LTR51_005638 [Lithohypha guttulata]